ncbi:crotonase/enoyl-CoA hydratase family protein [Geodermatophilus sp. TF02-6]|uniref:crotonase/enoyl-CoA hydratase family protein n=1 Tax=Geodermatophilus sp. TF02-6 TaxID=2250575 RepID=UPI001F4617CD|nr:crotonase/enoyl-CoA hydratase family protein [Geodermatophilus sp. TF02-6]
MSTPSADGCVLTAVDGPVLTITLNRPHVRNAIDAALSRAAAAAFRDFDDDPGLSIAVLTGAGGHFCAGMDLKAFSRGEAVGAEGGGLLGLTRQPTRKPVIAAVEGYALAGGFEVALACDMVVAAEGARFGIPEVSRGLMAGSGGLVALATHLPRAVAAEIAFTGRQLSAQEAARWGLVNAVVADGGAVARARELAAEIAANSPSAVAASKSVLLAALPMPGDALWSHQDALLEQVLASADAREGALAFVEKRAPVWAPLTAP